MSEEALTRSTEGFCPLCDASISPQDPAELSEVLSCPDCQSWIVVQSLEGSQIIFEEAPVIEEDWGE